MTDQPDAEGETERPTKDESTIGRLGAKIITTIPKPLLGIRGTLYKRMVIKGLENYHKTADGDAIGINAKDNQQVALEPVLYKTPEEADDGEKPGWHVKGRDKAWDPAKEGNNVNYLGRTPVVNLQDDEHVEAGWLAPRIGHAIELDNYRPVFTNPTFEAPLDAGAATNGHSAVADGGAVDLDLSLENPGVFSGDNIIDLNSGDGYAGMRISASKAREWQAENADSEQMQMQEERGRMIGMLNADEGPSTVKLLLICAAIILGALGIIEVLPVLLSGGGGGGGSINPLIIGATGLL